MVLIAVLFGTKYYVENRFEQELKQAIVLAQPFVSIRYKDLAIELDGSLSLSDIEIRSAELGSPVSIENINISSSDPLFLFRGKNAYADGDLPDSFSLDVEAFKFNSSLLPREDPSRECKFIDAGIDFANLGEPTISNDVKISLDMRDQSNALLNMTAINDFSTTKAQINFGIDGIGLRSRENQDVPINSFSFSDTLNQPHAEDVLRYCAEKLNLDQEDFITSVIGSSEFTRDLLGVDLGEAFRQALMKYSRGDSTLKIQSTPSNQLKNVGRASLYKNQDIVKMLNLSVQLDGADVPIEISELAIIEGQVEEEPSEAEESISLAKNLDTEEPEQDPRIAARIRYEEQKKNRKPAAYQLITLDQANNFKNYRVRIKRKNKPLVTGALKSYDRENGKLMVELSQYGGAVLFTINQSDINQIEVYH